MPPPARGAPCIVDHCLTTGQTCRVPPGGRCIHLCVSHVHTAEGVTGRFAADLAWAVDDVTSAPKVP